MGAKTKTADATAATKATKAPKATKIPKVAKAGQPGEKGKRRRPKNYTSFARFIMAVVRQVHPEAGMSKKAMRVLESMVKDMFVRIASVAREVVQKGGKRVLDARAIQTAVRLTLQGDLKKHAVSEGTKAVMKFTESTASGAAADK